MEEMMAARRGRRLIWLGFVLALPLPFFALQLGVAPPLRMLFLGSLVLGFFLSAPDSFSGLLLGLFVGQGLLWLGGTLLLARVVSNALGSDGGIERRRVLAVLGALFVIALLPVYRLPFSSGDLQTSWLGLFQ
jgi:hypothetical protein